VSAAKVQLTARGITGDLPEAVLSRASTATSSTLGQLVNSRVQGYCVPRRRCVHPNRRSAHRSRPPPWSRHVSMYQCINRNEAADAQHDNKRGEKQEDE